MSAEKHLMFVFSNPVEGRDDDYHAWYAGHINELLRVPGFVAGQRLQVRAAPDRPVPDHKYLVLYEIEGDPGEALAALRTASVEGKVSAPDPAVVQLPFRSFIYSPITGRLVSPNGK